MSRQIATDIAHSDKGAAEEPVAYILSELPKDHPLYGLIGRVTAEAAGIDYVLDKVIRRLTGLPDDQLACLTAQYMGASPRLLAIIALLFLRKATDKRFDKYFAKARELHQKIHGPFEQRNRIVHDLWRLDMDAKSTVQLSRMPRNKLHFGVVAKDEALLQKVQSDLAALSRDIKAFEKALIVVLEASRRKPPRSTS